MLETRTVHGKSPKPQNQVFSLHLLSMLDQGKAMFALPVPPCAYLHTSPFRFIPPTCHTKTLALSAFFRGKKFSELTLLVSLSALHTSPFRFIPNATQAFHLLPSFALYAFFRGKKSAN